MKRLGREAFAVGSFLVVLGLRAVTVMVFWDWLVADPQAPFKSIPRIGFEWALAVVLVYSAAAFRVRRDQREPLEPLIPRAHRNGEAGPAEHTHTHAKPARRVPQLFYPAWEDVPAIGLMWVIALVVHFR